MNEMDIGMARSFNVHTAKRLAHELGMNFAWGLEFVELTRGTKEEQNATAGRRNSLGLHGNAILSKCFIDDTMILRDPLPPTYFSKKPERGINANGYEIRLGGRMGLFARLFEKKPNPSDPVGSPQRYYSIGNVHKLKETAKTKAALFDYFGFNLTAAPLSPVPGIGVGPAEQIGVVVQGDFGPQFCQHAGLQNQNPRNLKTFRVTCQADGNHRIRPLWADYFCTDQLTRRKVQVTPSCYQTPGNKSSPMIRLADHAIVSIHVNGLKLNDAKLLNMSTAPI